MSLFLLKVLFETYTSFLEFIHTVVVVVVVVVVVEVVGVAVAVVVAVVVVVVCFKILYSSSLS